MHLNTRNQNRLNSKLPEMVKQILALGNCVLAGGRLCAILNGTKSNDYDIWSFHTVQTHYEFLQAVDQIVGGTSRWVSEHVFEFETTLDAFTLKIQVMNFSDKLNPQDVIDNFDISAVKIAWDGTTMWADRNDLRATFKKEIKFVKIKNPLSAFKRFLKYHDKGYSCNDAQMREFIEKLHVRLLTYNLNSDMHIEQLWNDYEER
jgi:hypothetical protein